MFSKFEMIGGGISVCLMAFAIYLLQMETNLDAGSQPAAVVQSDVVVVSEDSEQLFELDTVLKEQNNDKNDMKIDDIKIGSGEEAKVGDMVAVHYAGRLQNGTEFDNSHKRGAPIEFTIGAGQVIQGWEEGIAGMKVGGERTLVIPPEKAYGDAGIGPIPGGATLIFTVELVELK